MAAASCSCLCRFGFVVVRPAVLDTAGGCPRAARRSKVLKDRLKLSVAQLGRQALKRLLHCQAFPIAKKRLWSGRRISAWTDAMLALQGSCERAAASVRPGSPSMCTDPHQPSRVGWTWWASALYRPPAVIMLEAKPSSRPTSRPSLSCHVSHLPSRARQESDAKPLGERCGCATAAGAERPCPEHLDDVSAGSQPAGRHATCRCEAVAGAQSMRRACPT